MGFIYSNIFLDHLENTRNVGVIENPDGIGLAKSENGLCGDVVRIMISVTDNRISDIKFKVYGCATVIAGGSLITEMAKGLTVDEAMKIEADDLFEKIGGVPVNKRKCVRTVVRALKEALQDYYSKHSKNP